ncbi:hypothetical protein ES707_21047 [subsurface metagenome]
MEQNKQLSLHFANISGKKVAADFTGGDVTSDVGVLVMRETANKIGIIEQLAKAIHDERHQSYVKHEITEILTQRIFQIICGYDDANDANDLRVDPGFKASCDRLPSKADLASQPTLTRFKNSITTNSRHSSMRQPTAVVDKWKTLSKNTKSHSEAVEPHATVSLQIVSGLCFTVLHTLSCIHSEKKHSLEHLLLMLSLIQYG